MRRILSLSTLLFVANSQYFTSRAFKDSHYVITGDFHFLALKVQSLIIIVNEISYN